MVFKSEKKHEQKQQPHKTLQEDRRKKTVLCFSAFLRISVFCREEKGLSLGQASRPKHCNGKKKNKPEYAKHRIITKQAKA
jgi:hypothetical protein